ncbi:metal ABC transporter ATP-binding protein [Anaerolineales bacterium]
MENPKPVLSIRNLSVGYTRFPNALEDVSFDVNPGELIAIIGPNGAGKSTLFKAIMGIIPFRSGSISILGQDCQDSHGLVGYVPQHESIDWQFPASVTDVVMMGRVKKIGWFRLPSQKDKAIVHEILEQLGLYAIRNKQIGQLSGGQKRRTFVARALAKESAVLLMDEPFTGVDIEAQEDILNILMQLQEKGITVLLATHDLSIAYNYFDKILLLNRSVLAFDQPKLVFQENVLNSSTYSLKAIHEIKKNNQEGH